MRLILLEPRLKDYIGHFFNHNLALARAAQRMGMPVRAIIHRRADPALVSELARHGVEVTLRFHDDIIESLRARAFMWPLATLDYGYALYQEMRHSERDDILLTQSGELDYLAGVAMVMSASRRKKSDLYMKMFYWERNEATSATPRLVKFYRLMTEALLRRLHPGGLHLLGETAPIAAYIAERLGRDVLAVPVVIDWESMQRAPETHTILHVGFLGDMREEKGFRQFAEAIGRVKGLFVLETQAVQPTATPPAEAEALRAPLRKIPGAILHESPLSWEAYYDLVGKLDIVVLPYDPAKYRRRTSGILAEALGLEKVVVVPSNCYLGDTVKQIGAGITYDDYSVQGLSAAIEEAIRRHDEIRLRLKEVAPSWRARHSADEFLRVLLEHQATF